MSSAPAPRPQAVEQQAAGVGLFRPTLAAETADLWRELVHLCMETPCRP
jgi:hypothetical protein